MDKNLPKRELPKGMMSMMAPRVLAAKAQASKTTSAVDLTGSRSSTAPAPSQGAEIVTVTERITVQLDLRKQRLGVEADGSDGRTLLIKKVQAGAVDMWNALNPGKAIQINDRVISVNGISGDSSAMILECRERIVNVVVEGVRKRRSAGGAEPLRKKMKTAGAQDPANLYSFLPAPEPAKETAAPAPKKVQPQGPAPDDKSSIIFLDVDGVLRKVEGQPVVNIDGELLPVMDCHAKGRALLPEALRALQSIVHRTGAQIVLSSEWRRQPALKEEVQVMLRNFGISKIYGETPVLQAREDVFAQGTEGMGTLMLRWAERRAREISQWLSEHPEVIAWIALDDLDLGKADDFRKRFTFKMTPNLILTDQELALTASDGRRAAENLQKQRRQNGKVQINLSNMQSQHL